EGSGRPDAHPDRGARRRGAAGRARAHARRAGVSRHRPLVPRYAADTVLLAPLDDVWTFLAEPYNLADWWPGVSGVEPDRRGLAPGARWKVVGPDQPTYLRRPQATGMLLVLDVVPMQRISFQLTN